MSERLSLTEALKTDRLRDFIDQEETRGVAPIVEADFDIVAAAIIRTPRSGDQTSGSPPDGGSPGK